jgi:RNA polymerase sigma factor (sigma-70 family)
MNWSEAVVSRVGSSGPESDDRAETDVEEVRSRSGLRRPTSFDRLFAVMQRDVHRYFTRRLGDRELAAEHTQDTFLRFAKMGYRGDRADARPLLFGIARNLFLDHLRRRRRQEKLGFDDANRIDAAMLEGLPSRDGDPLLTINARDELEQVLSAVDNLPDKCRRVFIMHRLHGRSHKEIAQELGITLSMVEKHIMEATARLLKAME